MSEISVHNPDKTWHFCTSTALHNHTPRADFYGLIRLTSHEKCYA
ncbi:MAG: hypothetical protein ACQERO_09200 [Bacteroidota bacterium]